MSIKKESSQVDLEVQPLNIRIAALNNSPGIAEKEKELSIKLQKISRETIASKEKKLSQYRKAFTANKAYVWPNSQQIKSTKRSRIYCTHNNSNQEPVSSDSSASSVSSHGSFFSRRNFRQARKRPNEHQQDQSSEFKRRTDTRYTGDSSNEVMDNADSSVSLSTNSKTPNIFLGQQHISTPHPGTGLAHFPKQHVERNKNA